MKKIPFLIVLTITLVLAKSCVPDDGPVDPPKKENTSSEEVLNNVNIPGATRVEGQPPSPNQGISLTLDTQRTIALPEIGFSIPFESDGDVSGAYIQFRAEGEDYASAYYDVKLEDNVASSKSTKRSRASAKKPSDDSFNVNLKPDLSTGTFCYAICVYDQSGNISAPQELCVTINSWGGNTALEGTWNLLRTEELYEGNTDVEQVGIEECVTFSDETTCYLIDYNELTFDPDGTFRYEFRESNRNPATEPDYVDYDIERIAGNWSYDTSTGQLYFVIFSYEYEENGQVLETEIYPNGDDEFGVAQRIELGANTLQMVFDEIDSDGDGNIDESYIEYYER